MANPDWQTVVIRSCRYLNNIVEQDHRAIKRRCAPMLALKSFRTAAVTLAGIELVHRIKKGQFSLGSRGARGLSSLKHLWTHALKRRSVGAPARSEEPQPPMQQNLVATRLTISLKNNKFLDSTRKNLKSLPHRSEFPPFD
jgi:hypothetical protein